MSKVSEALTNGLKEDRPAANHCLNLTSGAQAFQPSKGPLYRTCGFQIGGVALFGGDGAGSMNDAGAYRWRQAVRTP